MNKHLERKWLGMRLAACTLLTCVTASTAAPVKMDAEADRVLTAELNQLLKRMPRIEGQQADVTGTARLDLSSCLVRANVSRGFVPRYNGGAFEDQMNELQIQLSSVAEKLGCEGTAVFMFGGLDIDYYFPEDAVPPGSGSAKAGLNRRSGITAVSAGHGYYFHHKGRGDWRQQRDPANGIVEDDITPGYVTELKALLESRGNRTVHRMRSISADAHEQSGHPWWQLSARYHLAFLLPEKTDIWHSLPNATGALRERDEDIRSRPLYANHLGADELIHIHSNGVANTTTRGTRAIYHVSKPQDIPLARSVLCYMKELINGQSGYEEFRVESEPHPGRQGENRLADMPSVIVETAFHSNPDDALALQDPVFRAASMKGVEKGYRLHLEGKECTPLKVFPIDRVSVNAGESRKIDLKFEGFPRYPVVVSTTNVLCPPGWTCTGGTVHLPDAESKTPHINVSCQNAGSAPIVWRTQMVDDDGARSTPVDHVVQCLRRPGSSRRLVAG